MERNAFNIFKTEAEAKEFIKELLTWENANPIIKYDVVYGEIYGWYVYYDTPKCGEVMNALLSEN